MQRRNSPGGGSACRGRVSVPVSGPRRWPCCYCPPRGDTSPPGLALPRCSPGRCARSPRAPRPHRRPGIPRVLQRWREPGLLVGTSPRALPLSRVGGLHHGDIRRRAWGVQRIVPSGVPGLALLLSWGLTVAMVRGGGDHNGRFRLSPLRSIPPPSPPSPQAKPLGEILRSIPANAAAPSLLPLSSDPGYSQCSGGAEVAPPDRSPPIYSGAQQTATGGGSSPGPPPAAASRGAGADPCAERLLRVKVCRELAHSGPGRGRLWGRSSGIHATAPGPPRAVGYKGGRGRTRRGKAETRPAGSALGPRDSRQQPPALDPRTK